VTHTDKEIFQASESKRESLVKRDIVLLSNLKFIQLSST
jgi:hypothetical protein